VRRYEILFAIVVILVLIGSWGLDRVVPKHAVASAPPATSSLPPLSEAWYCPVPSPQGLAATVETANLGGGSAQLRLTGLGAGSGAATLSTLPARALVSSPVAPPPASEPAIVEGFGQPIASYLTSASTTTGAMAARCTQQPGSRWLFAQASTAPGYDTYLYIANPFPEQAGVTIRVLGPSGDVVPPGLSNFQLPPSSQTKIFLGDYFAETTSFGLDVTTNRGRVIVSRLMKVASQDGVRGISMDTGAPAPATQWIFPGGQVPASGLEDMVIANPSTHEALVSESFLTAGGGAPAGQQNVAVPAGQQISIASSDEVPAGTQHGTIITSTNGVPVVAERVTVEGTGSARGYETVFGVPGWASSWLVPAGSPAGGTDTLGVVATGLGPATFGVTLVTGTGSSAPPALATLTVGPGTRGSFDLTPYLGGQPALALVHASAGSIAVESDVALPPAYRETLEAIGTPSG
jgi:hypothetical protein